MSGVWCFAFSPPWSVFDLIRLRFIFVAVTHRMEEVDALDEDSIDADLR